MEARVFRNAYFAIKRITLKSDQIQWCIRNPPRLILHLFISIYSLSIVEWCKPICKYGSDDLPPKKGSQLARIEQKLNQNLQNFSYLDLRAQDAQEEPKHHVFNTPEK